MTETLNWLALIAFAAASVYAARWIVQQSHTRWTGPTTPVAFAFLYIMTLATTAGLSFVVASILYYELLGQGDFMHLVGLSGAIKFLLIFTGLWYAALYGLKPRVKEPPK